MPVSKKRRIGPLGTRVLVCGAIVNKENNLVCLLSSNVQHKTHVSIAVTHENHLLLAFREGDKKETEWQPVNAPVERFMSRGPQ
jgi:hypothetical protein